MTLDKTKTVVLQSNTSLMWINDRSRRQQYFEPVGLSLKSDQSLHNWVLSVLIKDANLKPHLLQCVMSFLIVKSIGTTQYAYLAIAGEKADLDPLVELAEAPCPDTSDLHWGACCEAAGVEGVGQIEGLGVSSADGP